MSDPRVWHHRMPDRIEAVAGNRGGFVFAPQSKLPVSPSAIGCAVAGSATYPAGDSRACVFRASDRHSPGQHFWQSNCPKGIAWKFSTAPLPSLPSPLRTTGPRARMASPKERPSRAPTANRHERRCHRLHLPAAAADHRRRPLRLSSEDLRRGAEAIVGLSLPATVAQEQAWRGHPLCSRRRRPSRQQGPLYPERPPLTNLDAQLGVRPIGLTFHTCRWDPNTSVPSEMSASLQPSAETICRESGSWTAGLPRAPPALAVVRPGTVGHARHEIGL